MEEFEHMIEGTYQLSHFDKYMFLLNASKVRHLIASSQYGKTEVSESLIIKSIAIKKRI